MSMQLTEDFLKSQHGRQAQLEEGGGAVARGEMQDIRIQDDKLCIRFSWLALGENGRWRLINVRDVSFCATHLRVRESEQGYTEIRTLTLDRIIIFPPRSHDLLDPSDVEGLIPF